MSPSPDKPPAYQRRVLVVDDEPTLRLGFAYALAGPAIKVETAGNGRKALERIAETDFDLVILDLRMPDLDGLAVIDELRLRENPISIVLCTAALTPNAALRAIRRRVVDFLQKPVRPVDLRAVVGFVLDPPADRFSQAMQSARAGDFASAIEILPQVSSSDERAAAWLEVLELIHPGDPDRSYPPIEEMVRANLKTLAFTAP